MFILKAFYIKIKDKFIRGRILRFNLLRLGIITFIFALGLICPFSQAQNTDEFDTIRAELATIKDKNSPYYTKTAQKLEKFIIKNKIDYSDFARFSDVQRLISQQKYNCAIFELNSLIEKGYQISKCNELLGDISSKCQNPAKKTAQYYKLALQYDRDNIDAAYKLSKLYFREKRNIIAIEYLKQVIEKTDDCAQLNEIKDIILNKITPQSKYEANNLYEALGSIYVKLGDKENSYEAFSKAIILNPRDIYLKYYLSSLLYEDNQNDHATALFNSILNENPKDAQIKTLRAKTLAKKGNLTAANQEYLEILQMYPNSKQARYGIFKLYENTLTPEDAYKKTYQKKDSYTPTTKELYAFSGFLKEMEDINAAQNVEAYVLNIKEIKKQQEIARLEKLKKEQEQKALIAQKNAAQKNITTPKAAPKKDIQKQQSKIERQKQAQLEIQKEKQRKQAELEKQKEQKALAIKKEKQERLEREEKARLKALEEEKIKQAKLNEQKQAQYEKNSIEQEQKKAQAKDPKKYNELKATIDKYLALEPKTAQNYIAAANTYKQLAMPYNALKYYKEAMKLDPTNSDIYYSLGLTYFELNSSQSAKSNLIKAINLDTQNTKAKNLLAFVNQKIITQTINRAFELYEEKEYIQALEILDKGIKDYEQNAQMYYYRALVYDAMQRNAAAIIDLQKAIEYDPGHYMAYYQLGNLYEKIRDERSALVAYERFLSIEPDEKELIDEIQKKVIALQAKYY